MTKRELRMHLRHVLGSMSSQERAAASQAMCEQLAAIASIEMATTLFVYLPLPDELDLRPLIQRWLDEDRIVGVPLVSWKDRTMQVGRVTSLDAHTLVTTKHSLLEPHGRTFIPTDSVDAMLVPGLGFDAAGGRLGRGGGYYDRFIGTTRPPIVVGVAFDEQIIPTVPHEEHDQHMTIVVTPTRILT